MALDKTVGTGSKYYIANHPGAGMTESEINVLKTLAEGGGNSAVAADDGNLAGTLTGTTDGTLADVADIAISTSSGNTYADAAVNTAVNTAIASVNLQLKELQTKLNALMDDLRSAGLIA